MANREHAKRLLKADREEDVTTLLDELKRTYDVTWTPIGEQENNYGVVEAQTISPLGALNEIISNGIDAVLRRSYREKFGDQYDAGHDITSYAEAGDILLEGDEEVRVIADGFTGGPTNVTVYDSGEGQPPEKFEETFVGLLQPGMAKQGWPFLQGQFGMGSTAVLPHCGKRGYKAIFTAGMDQPGTWVWTVVRRNKDGNAYEYMKSDGGLPEFQGEMAGRDGGTFVKMFNYDLPIHSNVTADLRYKFARTMTEVPVPVMMDERRDYQAEMMEANLLGFKELMEKHSDYIERRETREYDFGGEIGKREVDVAVFKSDGEVESDPELDKTRYKKRIFVSNTKQHDRAIFFTVNGQVHGDFGLSFIKNRCGKYHIGKDTVAFVDFSDFGPAQLTDLFTPARDRLTDKPMAHRLRDGMEDLITNDPMLNELEQQRRESFTRDKREEKMGDVLEDLVERNPALLNYLDEGEKVETSSASEDAVSDDYSAPFYPDTLEIIKGKTDGTWDYWNDAEDGRYEMDLAVNRNGWVAMHLNAPNNFFTREDSPGKIAAEPSEAIKSWGLSDGMLSIQLKSLEAATPGMTVPISVAVTAEGMGPLKQSFNLNYTEEPKDTEGIDAESIPPLEALDFPDIIPLYREDWDEAPAPFDENTPVRLTGSGSDMDIYVNFDAAPIQNFLSRYNLRKTGKETVKETWRAGVALYAISTYIEVDEEFAEHDIEPQQVAEVSMRGVVQSMLDQQISDSELEALTV